MPTVGELLGAYDDYLSRYVLINSQLMSESAVLLLPTNDGAA